MTANRSKHTLDLVKFPFIDNHLNKRLVAVLQNRYLGGQTFCAILQPRSVTERLRRRLGQRLVQPRLIPFRHVVARAQQIVRKIAIVGDEHQPVRILVQPSRRKQPASAILLREQIDNGARLRIARNPLNARGLI